MQGVGAAASAPPELDEDPLASDELLEPPEELLLDDVPLSSPPSCPPEEPPKLTPELLLEVLPELPPELNPEELPPFEEPPPSGPPPPAGVLPPPLHPSPTAIAIETAPQAFKVFIERYCATDASLPGNKAEHLRSHPDLLAGNSPMPPHRPRVRSVASPTAEDAQKEEKDVDEVEVQRGRADKRFATTRPTAGRRPTRRRHRDCPAAQARTST